MSGSGNPGADQGRAAVWSQASTNDSSFPLLASYAAVTNILGFKTKSSHNIDKTRHLYISGERLEEKVGIARCKQLKFSAWGLLCSSHYTSHEGYGLCCELTLFTRHWQTFKILSLSIHLKPLCHLLGLWLYNSLATMPGGYNGSIFLTQALRGCITCICWYKSYAANCMFTRISHLFIFIPWAFISNVLNV